MNRPGQFYKGHTLNVGRKRSADFKKRVSDSLQGYSHSESAKKKIGLAAKGRNLGNLPKNIEGPGRFGNIVRGYFDIEGKKMFFRSKWEANYALYLNFLVKQKLILKWEFEAESFLFDKIKSGTRTYRPDFKVYNLDGTHEFHEVKGWMDPRSATKLKRMKKYFPEIKVILVDADSYNDIKKKLGKMLKFY